MLLSPGPRIRIMLVVFLVFISSCARLELGIRSTNDRHVSFVLFGAPSCRVAQLLICFEIDLFFTTFTDWVLTSAFFFRLSVEWQFDIIIPTNSNLDHDHHDPNMLTAKTSQPIPSPRPVSPFLLLECPRFHFHIIYACIVPLHRSARPNSCLTRESTPTIIYCSALSARPCPLPPTHSIRRCFPNSSTYSPIPSFLLAITILSTLPTPAQQQYLKHSLEHGGTTSLP